MSSPMDLSHPLPTPYPKKSLYDPPIRILVDTRIHLLPGDTNEDRNTFLINHICHLHWHTEFIPSKHRRYAFSTERYPIESTRCLFLVDCGQTASKEEDEDVPVVYYKWTGGYLTPLPILSYEAWIKNKLKYVYPFTPAPNWQNGVNRDREREMLLSKVLWASSSGGATDDDLRALRDNEEDWAWLRATLDPDVFGGFLYEARRRIY
ncbi:uncharacterized protein BO87DRAFT_396804 [Aspergillus neoniger CBS 115656]|uniref:Uncharacterized protein n=1 Tax=Aspergillus neoniger (strain CBS 115656) TaxID=1448310 RepID=A0A318YIZ5_ASPNB|nr:hypothetical protein BO87DRAFT_396804 [Aspergillus neoniger CBS 115656]PYH34511.1 hypothetical protein BO87DRAFT_396804 [Aspergillus neoniger CBS 115656]